MKYVGRGQEEKVTLAGVNAVTTSWLSKDEPKESAGPTIESPLA
jgi:hypothetical protein